MAVVPAAAASAAAQPIFVTLTNAPSPVTWLQYVQVFVTILVTVVAALIAYSIQRRQVAIAHRSAVIAANKLKLDLFERRLEIYEAAIALVRTTFYRGGDDPAGDQARLSELHSKLAPARWLLDEEAATELDRVWKEAEKNMDDRHRGEQHRDPSKPIDWEKMAELVKADLKRKGDEQLAIKHLFDKFMLIER